MEIKQYHIYFLQNDSSKNVGSQAIVIQNDMANEKSDKIVIVPYVNEEFIGIYTVNREDLREDIGILPDDKQSELREYYLSLVIS